jgi:hypothetical protein
MSDTKTRRPIRWVRNGSAGIVAGIAGWASYWHQVHVAQLAGERDELAHVIPFSVDGVLVVASIAMVDARQQGRNPSWQTKVAFAVGIAASVGANVLSAQPTYLGRGVGAWPSIALLLVVEVLSSKGRIRREKAVAATIEAAVTQPSPAVAPTKPKGKPGPQGPTGPRGEEYAKRTVRLQKQQAREAAAAAAEATRQ